MRSRSALLPAALLLLLALSAPGASRADGDKVWSFAADSPGAAPSGFSLARTGSGAVGRWVVREASDAPSPPLVVVQVDTDETDYRFPLAVADAPSFRDGRASVKCKPVSGKVDQACGLVFRYRDENNYYVARANALEDNVNLYFVKDGRRRQIAGSRAKVESGAWHELAATAEGDHLAVWFDGKKLVDTRDATFAEAGRVGLWTKADSVTEFDDLKIVPADSR